VALATIKLRADGFVDLPRLEQLADVTPDSWDAKARTFEMILYSGAPVLRRGWDGPFTMQFSLEDGAVRTGRLAAGIPILMDHGWTKLVDPQVGISRSFRFDDSSGSRKLHVVAQLSDRAEVQPIAQDVAAKIKRNVSMGAQPHRVKVKAANEETKTLEHWTVTDWEVLEGSLVAVPADFGATVLDARGQPAGGGLALDGSDVQVHRCSVVIESPLDPKTGRLATEDQGEGTRVTPEELEAKRLADEAKARSDAAAMKLATDQAAADAVKRERARVKLVRELCAAHKCDEKFTLALEANEKLSDVELRDAVLEHLSTRTTKLPTPITALGAEPQDHRKAGMIEALEARVGLRERSKVSEAGRRFLTGPAVFAYGRYLEECGEKIDAHDVESVGRLAFGMIGTSDLPKLFENIAEKSLMKGYSAIPTTWLQVTDDSVSAPDFKDRAVVHTGLGPALVEVPESKEIPSGGQSEGGEKYRVRRFAIIKPYSFEALRNDDLGAIGREQENLGKQAALNVDATLWALVLGNGAVMADGVALFNAAHSNLAGSGKNYTLVGSNAQLGIAELERVLRVQTDDDGVTMLGTPPAFLMGPAALAYQLRQLTSAAIQPNAQNQVPVFGFLNPIINPRLDATSAIIYYLIAPKEIMPLFEVAYLDGNKLPKIDSQEGFDQDALRIRCRWYWGGCLTNHRAIAKSTGADA
jgi:predicted DNA-binding protein (UPF0251 family)